MNTTLLQGKPLEELRRGMMYGTDMDYDSALAIAKVLQEHGEIPAEFGDNEDRFCGLKREWIHKYASRIKI